MCGQDGGWSLSFAGTQLSPVPSGHSVGDIAPARFMAHPQSGFTCGAVTLWCPKVFYFQFEYIFSLTDHRGGENKIITEKRKKYSCFCWCRVPPRFKNMNT